jgi:hypothetical protein
MNEAEKSSAGGARAEAREIEREREGGREGGRGRGGGYQLASSGREVGVFLRKQYMTGSGCCLEKQ